ncbi:MAG: exopolysaccharide biosynthesis protein [Litorimonas sp.]
MNRKRTLNPDVSTPDIIGFLKESAEDLLEERIVFRDLLAALGPRSFGVSILFFSIPMILPMPPGIPLSVGVVIVILGIQISLGRPHLRLPKWMNEKSIDRKLLLKAYTITDRYVGWMFRLAKYRLPRLTGPLSFRLSGGIFTVLGILMILPIPIIGNIFPAISCTIIALGLTDRDGLIFVFGLIFTTITLVAMFFMSAGAISVLERLL